MVIPSSSGPAGSPVTAALAASENGHYVGYARARIKHALGQKGVAMSASDLWIAASARRHQCTLATNDAAFSQVEGLAVIAAGP